MRTTAIDLTEHIDALRRTSTALLHRVTGSTPLIHNEEILQNLQRLEQQTHEILTHRKSLKAHVPRALLRHWAIGSFRAALRKKHKALKLYNEKDEAFLQQVRFTALWAYQGCDIAQVTGFVRKILKRLEDFTLYSSHLEKGDLILSYKTDKFLARDPLARLIAITTNSHITHTLMVSNDHKPQHLLSVNPDSGGLGFRHITPKKGEMFIVMRYRTAVDGVSKQKILESMDSLYQQNSRHGQEISFAELKSWVACAIGFVYVVSAMAFERPLCLPNPVKKSTALYCSEFVDEVFGRADAYLSPRSEHHAVVGPAEIFYSPFLEFKGVIFHQEDKRELIHQVARTFTLLYEVDADSFENGTVRA